MRQFVVRGVLIVGGLIVSASSTSASPLTVESCNASGVCGQIQVITTLNGSAIDVDVPAVPGGPALGLFGDTGANRAFAFNVLGSDTGIAFSNLTAGFSDAGPGLNVGGPFGDFEFVLNGPHTASAALLPLHFTVTRPGGFSSSALLDTNDDGYLFTAHLETGGWVAGGESPTSQLSPRQEALTANPEPASLILLGSGLVVIASRIRRYAK